jgi:hypothetical protein
MVEWSSLLDRSKGSPGAVWPCLPWKEEVTTPVPTGRRGKPLDGASHHGPLQERWPAMGEAHDDSTRAASKGKEAQAAESVGDKLEAPNINGFAERKAIAWGTLTFGNGDEHR